MLEGLILGVFLMTAEQATTPAAPAESQTSSSAAGDPAATADPTAADPAAPASTETTAPPADATPAQASNTEDNHRRVRCRRGPPEIGSIMGRRICSSQAQDDERAQRDAAELRRMQQMQTTAGGLGSGN